MNPLDLVAMSFTGASTWLFVCRRKKLAYASLLIGSVLWAAVGMLSSFGGRPVYGMLLSSINTFIACIVGLRTLQPDIDPTYHKHLETYKRVTQKAMNDEYTRQMNAELEGYEPHKLTLARTEGPEVLT